MIVQPILATMRGSIGGITASHNRGGDYFRRRVAPTNPNSTRQQTMRTILAGLARDWAAILTDDQRNAWNTWASQQPKEGPLGNSINLTGINGFIWCNSRILDAGDEKILIPPPQVAPSPLLTLSVDVSAALVADVTFTDTPLEATDRIIMFMSLPQAGEAEPNFKQCRIVGYSDKAQATPWAAALPFTVGLAMKVIFFAAVYQANLGLLSQYLRAVDTADY